MTIRAMDKDFMAFPKKLVKAVILSSLPSSSVQAKDTFYRNWFRMKGNMDA
jgi:hypothetical protein